MAQAGKAGHSTDGTQELWLYLEEAKNNKPLVPIAPDNIMLFFKLYDPKRQKLSYLGRCLGNQQAAGPMAFPETQGWLHNVALEMSALV